MKKQAETITWQKTAQLDTGNRNRTEDKNGRINRCVYGIKQVILYALFLASAVCMAGDVYPEIVPAWTAFVPLGVLVLISVLLNALFFPYRQKRMRIPGNTALLVLAVAQAYGFYRKNKEAVESGLLAVGGDYIRLWNRYYGTAFSVLEGDAACRRLAVAFVLFLITAVLLFFAGIFEKKRLMGLLPAAVLVSELLVGLAPGYLALVLLLFGILFGTAVIRQPEQGGKKAIFVMASAAAVFAGVFVFFQKPAEQLVGMEPQFNDFQSDLEQELKTFGSSLLSFPVQDGTVDNHTPKYRNKEVMKVHLNRSYGGARLYLRGYYGTDYENGVWENTDADFAEACNKQGITEADGAYYLAQFPHLYQSYIRMGNTKVTCQVSYTGIHDTYTYLPYGMNFSKPDEALLLSGDYNLKKAKKCETISAEGTTLCLMPDELPTSSIEDILASSDMMLAENTGGIWGEEEEFFSWYNQYVMEHDMTVPKEEKAVRELADEIRAEKEAFEERNVYAVFYDDDTASVNAERARYVSFVQNKLSDLGTYSLELDSVRGEDAVEYFLSTSHRGYCVHFASAGVFLLRELGVPARFVTGYVTQPNGTEGDTNDILTNVDYTVLDSGAHAWVEVYYDDYGWVPAEMTPGYQSGVSKYPTEWTKEEAERYQKTGQNPVSETESDSRTQTEETETTDPDVMDSSEQKEALEQESQAEAQKKNAENAGNLAQNKKGTSGRTKNGTGRVVSGLLGILAAIAVFLFGRFFFTAEKKARASRFTKRLDRRMKQEKYDEAVQQINRALYEFLQKKCHSKTAWDDAGYLRMLQEQFAEISSEEWERYMDIARKAAFAKGKVTREEAKLCRQIYRKVVCRNSK